MSFEGIKLPDEKDIQNTFILYMLKSWHDSGLIRLEYNTEKDVYIVDLKGKTPKKKESNKIDVHQIKRMIQDLKDQVQKEKGDTKND